MNKIPKKIHYCWFGNNPISETTKKYIETWKKYCPDYEIKEWNEKNFNINSNRYVKEAYEAKKYAFVSDYVRLYALYEEGGIYMDTDVEVIKPLDTFLTHNIFIGFESEDSLGTGVIGSEKGNELIKIFMSDYDNISFYKKNGEMDLTTNVQRITSIINKKYNIVLDETNRKIDNISLYPKEYFSPKSLHTGAMEVTENTYTIHHYEASWRTKEEKIIVNIRRKLFYKYGREKVEKKFIFFTRVYKMIFHPIKSIKKIIKIILKQQD